MGLNRRQFLTSGTTAATLALASRAFAQWQPSQRYPDPSIQIVDQGFARYRLNLAKVERLASGRLEIRLQEFTDYVEVEFHDTGCGMTPEVLHNIFVPFYTTKPSGQGTGLGLPISHRIVTDHGGRLAASSDGPGLGSTFRLSLPRVAVSHEAAA